jgi:hypothetical protein
MGMNPAARIKKWDLKYNTERIKAMLDEQRPDMLKKIEATIPALASMEGQVKQTLDLLGLQTIQYPFYLCFGRELWKMVNSREMSGETAAIAAQTLIDKWVSRGLVQSALESIRTGVFNIASPVAP